MSVLKSKRQKSQFEVFHSYYKLRREITDLLLRDFGFSPEKAEAKVRKLFQGKAVEEMNESERARYETLKSSGHTSRKNQQHSSLPYLIHDNGASLTGKGVGFTRRRLVEHLVRYYNQHGNDGYILLMDYSKYYDNIRHDILLDLFKRYIHDETAIWLLETIIDRFAVDVSYMSDEEYAHCMDALFNSLEYRKLDTSLLTGEKYMRKHLDIGNQTSQSAGILYPSPIDNYIKIVRGEKFYARYMDDSYCIHESREYLQALFADVLALTKEQGIILNENKSHIARLSDYWRFLQVQYSLDETGRIIQKINPRQVTVMRRKMKSISPRMTVREYRVWVRAWVRSHRKLMSNQQYENIMYLLSQEVTKCIA